MPSTALLWFSDGDVFRASYTAFREIATQFLKEFPVIIIQSLGLLHILRIGQRTPADIIGNRAVRIDEGAEIAKSPFKRLCICGSIIAEVVILFQFTCANLNKMVFVDGLYGLFLFRFWRYCISVILP